MRITKGFTALVIAANLVGVFAKADFTPQLVNQLPGRVFTPVGFDDNDNTQVVLDGYFSNTCYKVGPTQVSVSASDKKIVIKNQAYYYSGDLCLMMLVPYSKVVDVGMVPQGNYDVVMVDENAGMLKMGALDITTSRTPSQDEFLYAPVTQAHISKKQGKNFLTLEGTFTTNCMSLKEVRVVYEPKDVVVVLPIAELKGTTCESKEIPFSQSVELDSKLTGKRVLFHIRSLNGQAVNFVQSIDPVLN